MDVVYILCNWVALSSLHIVFNFAFRYHKASKLAPLLYLENVFTLLADAFIFDYTFVLTDYIGILGLIINFICYYFVLKMAI